MTFSMDHINQILQFNTNSIKQFKTITCSHLLMYESFKISCTLQEESKNKIIIIVIKDTDSVHTSECSSRFSARPPEVDSLVANCNLMTMMKYAGH